VGTTETKSYAKASVFRELTNFQGAALLFQLLRVSFFEKLLLKTVEEISTATKSQSE
jgi:hypothetical protein